MLHQITTNLIRWHKDFRTRNLADAQRGVTFLVWKKVITVYILTMFLSIKHQFLLTKHGN